VAGDAKDEVGQKELKKFEGTWALTSAERNGAKAPAMHIIEKAIQNAGILCRRTAKTLAA
jgi:hypothetical protein